jgi:SNF2 family DNA or RNA helicase
LLRLRQVCLSPNLIDPDEDGGVKTEWLEGLLEERFEAHRKTLVFSQFSGFLRSCEKRIEARFGKVFRLDGSTTNRGALVDAFQHHAGPAVFLISLKAGGYGLNLTAADTVVHMDPWWNPAAEAQASDRAHRIGQSVPVSVYRLLVRDSVEERVRQLQESKRALIAGVSGGESGQGWSNEEMRGLLLQ